MTATTDSMVQIPAGEFAMGSNEFYPDEAPVRRVAVEGFSIDAHHVTNDEFSDFIDATGYVTMAERAPEPELYPGAKAEDLVPGSLVFTMSDGPVDLRNYGNWWRWTRGAQWRNPTGPESTLDGLSDHPVVHVAYEDVISYLDWAGGALVSEAEWEFAARGGLDEKRFVWGDDDPQESEPVANTWQGRFPYENTEVDGFTRTSPVGTFPPNGYGLYDMAGNVWEWTNDWYTDKPGTLVENSCCAPVDPRGGREEDSLDPNQPETPIPRKVIKGGSHLCTPQYCYRYRPAARQPQMLDTSTSHLGFRRIVR